MPPTSVWSCTVPKLTTPSVSCGFVIGSGCSVVFVDDPAQATVSPDRGAERDDGSGIVVRRAVLTALVWTVIIEMPGVLTEDRDSMAFLVDQHLVGALRSDTAYEPLHITVRSGRLRRGLHHVDALGGEHRVGVAARHVTQGGGGAGPVALAWSGDTVVARVEARPG
jgi:hypothetical protein